MATQIIDFSTPKPNLTPNYSLSFYQDCSYSSTYKCWRISGVKGFFKFRLTLPKKQGVILSFSLCSAIVSGVSDCPITITVNGKKLVEKFDPHIGNFYHASWPVPERILKTGDNDIILTLDGGSTEVFMRSAGIDLSQVPINNKNWMGGLQDNLEISEVNIPGAHDAAAINQYTHTPYACHYATITEQLNGGIRLFDIRLKVKKENNQYSFVTCHGDIGSSTGINEYQGFQSFLDECSKFLQANPTEFLVVSLKMDDWSSYGNDKANVFTALEKILNKYGKISGMPTIPTVRQMRGKIVLLNRLEAPENHMFGPKISWNDSTEGMYVTTSQKNFKLYVQDKYKGLPVIGSEEEKLRLVTNTFGKKKTKEIVLNYASATWYGVFGVYIMGELLNYFGKSPASARKKTFGWIFFDYEFTKYNTSLYQNIDIVSLIVDSNFGYKQYPAQFSLTDQTEL